MTFSRTDKMQRKRIVKRVEKVLSCSGMKIIQYALFVLVLACLFGCKDANYSESWRKYCEKYDVSVDNPTEKQENYYLDCYVGSVEEENDLTGKN